MAEAKKKVSYIKLNAITKEFKIGGESFLALDDISVVFHQQEFTSVVGRSGSGKSTLMNMITGIDKPTAGEVEINGQKIHTLPETEMAKWRGQNLGIVFQFYQLIPVLSLMENVMLPMQIAGKYTHEERQERALDLLTQVNLRQQAGKRPYAVSGGQQQSTAIARALANDPPILIADEPTGNLGSAEADQVFNIFSRLSEQGKTIIMVTHDDELAARAQRVLKLADGRLVGEKEPSRSWFNRMRKKIR